MFQKVIQKMVPKFQSSRVFLRKRKNEVIKSVQKKSKNSPKKVPKKCQKKSQKSPKKVSKKVLKKGPKKSQKKGQKKDQKRSLFLRHFWCQKLDKKGTHFWLDLTWGWPPQVMRDLWGTWPYFLGRHLVCADGNVWTCVTIACAQKRDVDWAHRTLPPNFWHLNRNPSIPHGVVLNYLLLELDFGVTFFRCKLILIFFCHFFFLTLFFFDVFFLTLFFIHLLIFFWVLFLSLFLSLFLTFFCHFFWHFFCHFFCHFFLTILFTLVFSRHVFFPGQIFWGFHTTRRGKSNNPIDILAEFQSIQNYSHLCRDQKLECSDPLSY